MSALRYMLRFQLTYVFGALTEVYVDERRGLSVLEQSKLYVWVLVLNRRQLVFHELPAYNHNKLRRCTYVRTCMLHVGIIRTVCAYRKPLLFGPCVLNVSVTTFTESLRCSLLLERNSSLFMKA